jgi:hypothetical protein
MQVRGRGDFDLIIHARLKVLGNKPLGHRKSVRTIVLHTCEFSRRPAYSASSR